MPSGQRKASAGAGRKQPNNETIATTTGASKTPEYPVQEQQFIPIPNQEVPAVATTATTTTALSTSNGNNNANSNTTPHWTAALSLRKGRKSSFPSKSTPTNTTNPPPTTTTTTVVPQQLPQQLPKKIRSLPNKEQWFMQTDEKEPLDDLSSLGLSIFMPRVRSLPPREPAVAAPTTSETTTTGTNEASSSNINTVMSPLTKASHSSKKESASTETTTATNNGPSTAKSVGTTPAVAATAEKAALPRKKRDSIFSYFGRKQQSLKQQQSSPQSQQEQQQAPQDCRDDVPSTANKEGHANAQQSSAVVTATPSPRYPDSDRPGDTAMEQRRQDASPPRSGRSAFSKVKPPQQRSVGWRTQQELYQDLKKRLVRNDKKRPSNRQTSFWGGAGGTCLQDCSNPFAMASCNTLLTTVDSSDNTSWKADDDDEEEDDDEDEDDDDTAGDATDDATEDDDEDDDITEDDYDDDEETDVNTCDRSKQSRRTKRSTRTFPESASGVVQQVMDLSCAPMSHSGKTNDMMNLSSCAPPTTMILGNPDYTSDIMDLSCGPPSSHSLLSSSLSHPEAKRILDMSSCGPGSNSSRLIRGGRFTCGDTSDEATALSLMPTPHKARTDRDDDEDGTLVSAPYGLRCERDFSQLYYSHQQDLVSPMEGLRYLSRLSGFQNS